MCRFQKEDIKLALTSAGVLIVFLALTIVLTGLGIYVGAFLFLIHSDQTIMVIQLLLISALVPAIAAMFRNKVFVRPACVFAVSIFVTLLATQIQTNADSQIKQIKKEFQDVALNAQRSEIPIEGGDNPHTVILDYHGRINQILEKRDQRLKQMNRIILFGGWYVRNDGESQFTAVYFGKWKLSKR